MTNAIPSAALPPTTTPTTLRAVLFDMDDTLLDWSGASSVIGGTQHRLIPLANVYRYVLREVYPLTVSEEDFQQIALNLLDHTWVEARQGRGAPHMGIILAKTLTTLGVPADKIHTAQLLQVYDWSPIPGVVPFPDVYDVMPILHDAGLKIGIVTNSGHPMWMRDIELSAYEMLPLFPDCRFSAADIGYVKPFPQIFQAVLDCLGVQPSEAIFVGDEPLADIVGAHSVGMRAVLRVRPGAPIDRDGSLSVAGYTVKPDGYITDLHELLALLDQWYPGWRASA